MNVYPVQKAFCKIEIAIHRGNLLLYEKNTVSKYPFDTVFFFMNILTKYNYQLFSKPQLFTSYTLKSLFVRLSHD